MFAHKQEERAVIETGPKEGRAGEKERGIALVGRSPVAAMFAA
jgi:hypothetical protein